MIRIFAVIKPEARKDVLKRIKEDIFKGAELPDSIPSGELQIECDPYKFSNYGILTVSHFEPEGKTIVLDSSTVKKTIVQL